MKIGIAKLVPGKEERKKKEKNVVMERVGRDTLESEERSVLCYIEAFYATRWCEVDADREK